MPKKPKQIFKIGDLVEIDYKFDVSKKPITFVINNIDYEPDGGYWWYGNYDREGYESCINNGWRKESLKLIRSAASSLESRMKQLRDYSV